MASKRPSKRLAADEPPAYQTTLPKTSLTKYIPEEDSEDSDPPKESRSRTQKPQPSSSRREYGNENSDEPPVQTRRGGKQNATAKSSHRDKTALAKYIPEEVSEDSDPPKESRSRTQKPQPSSSRREYGNNHSDEPHVQTRRGGKQNVTAKSSHRDKTALAKYVPEEDCEDSDPPKESRSRTQKHEPSTSRRQYDNDESDEPPAEDRRRGKQKTTAKSLHRDDRRERYDSGDDDRYGRSRRDNGNRARDRNESRSRSRSRYRGSTTALVKHGESSRTMTKRDSRSRADAKGRSNNRAKHDHSDEDEEEEVIKIARYSSADFDDLEPNFVETLCKVLDVRTSKIKQWCERDLIRRDNTTGVIDTKRLLNVVDEEDAKKLRRFMKKLDEEKKVAKLYGGHNKRRSYDHIHHYNDFFPNGLLKVSMSGITFEVTPHHRTHAPVIASCDLCDQFGIFCKQHGAVLMEICGIK